MLIAVPSRSRWDNLRTLFNIHGCMGRFQITLFVPPDQEEKYRESTEGLFTSNKVFPLKIIPVAGRIAEVRQAMNEYAIAEGYEKILMLDDDLRFGNRKSPESTKLETCTPDEILRLMRIVEHHLETFKHVAISPRQGNNQYPYPHILNNRPLRALGFRTKELSEVIHGRVEIMEDFDIALQLMYKGYDNLVITSHTQDHIGTQEPGGCADYRDHDLHSRNVRRMAEIHGEIVSIQQKKNKTGGEFGIREELRIFWKKAIAKGKAGG